MDDQFSKKRGEVLAKLLLSGEEKEAQRKAASLNIPYINLKKTPIEPDALEVIKEESAISGQVLPFQKLDKKIAIALVDPNKPETIKILADLETLGFKTTIYMVSLTNFNLAIAKYKILKPKQAKITDQIDISESPAVTFQDLDEALEPIKSNITQLTGLILKSAIGADASDIHIESQKTGALLRFRIDGLLYDIYNMDIKTYKGLRDRLKLLSGMMINIQNTPQDGRFTIIDGSAIFEVRASSIPGSNGEFLVFRLLNPKRISFNLENLGFKEQDIKIINSQINASNGLILNTGPTGSGKTTTLYALLKKKISPGIKIITIEDPIEYHINNITQTQVDEKQKYDFANGLKSILRQDPDVILVGEIRDKDTAETAIQAALTGHLVFSTLHTNEASDTISRLLELGVNKKLLPSALRLIMSQRLVRTLCPYCKEEYQPDKTLEEDILKTFAVISPKAKLEIPKSIPKLYRSRGCPRCMSLGYKGQIAIYEGLSLSEKIISLIMSEQPINTIREAAIDEGMVPMFHDGLIKAINGITSIEEVFRVAGDIEYIKRLYDKIISRTLTRSINISDETQKETGVFLEKKEKRKSIISNLNPDKALEIIIFGAIESRATDIHIEPEEEKTVVRYRIDGVLHNVVDILNKNYPPVVNKIKELSGLETQVTQQTQESRFNINTPKKKYDARLSIVPGGYGEAIALRILSGNLETLKIEDLGIIPETLSIIEQSIKPTGILLVCGPTGSGKTTTLFAILNKLNKPEVKIITVEDPIEYRIEGALQTQVDEKNGYTFELALKTLLRQNPNIILIGEIRDPVTAELAIQAALTGHLILSSLHTSDALSSIARLESLGLSKNSIANGLNGIISQRLIRKLCPECKIALTPTKEQENFIKEQARKAPDKYKGYFAIDNKTKIYRAKGCNKCQYTGYQGQTAIFEAIKVDENLKLLINEGLNYNQIAEKLEGQYLAIAGDGLIKIIKGITDFSELERVLGLQIKNSR